MQMHTIYRFILSYLAHVYTGISHPIFHSCSFRFVTIDSSTSQQDLVSILLNLGSKRICDEPVKARLKTQSAATPGVPMQGGGWNPYRSKYHGYNNNNGQTYTGDRASFNPRKFSNRPYSKRRGKAGDSPGTHKEYDDAEKKSAKVENAGPPPPLVEEHFPGLSGSPKSTNAAGEEIGNDNEVKKEILTNSGYAAALLKAAPPMPDVSSQTEPEKSSLPKPKSPARKVRLVSKLQFLTQIWSEDNYFVSLSTVLIPLCVYMYSYCLTKSKSFMNPFEFFSL
jgi:hypothetical protein